MQLKFLAAAILAAATLSACYTRPVVVETPAPIIVESPPPQPVYVPVPNPPPASMSLHDRVHAALRGGMGSAASGISVRVDGSTVYLTGHVATRADHDRAHAIAHGVSGVTRVDHSGLMVH